MPGDDFTGILFGYFVLFQSLETRQDVFRRRFADGRGYLVRIRHDHRSGVSNLKLTAETRFIGGIQGDDQMSLHSLVTAFPESLAATNVWQ